MDAMCGERRTARNGCATKRGNAGLKPGATRADEKMNRSTARNGCATKRGNAGLKSGSLFFGYVGAEAPTS